MTYVCIMDTCVWSLKATHGRRATGIEGNVISTESKRSANCLVDASIWKATLKASWECPQSQRFQKWDVQLKG
jgi:hypothetical protein